MKRIMMIALLMFCPVCGCGLSPADKDCAKYCDVQLKHVYGYSGIEKHGVFGQMIPTAEYARRTCRCGVTFRFPVKFLAKKEKKEKKAEKE